MTPFVVAPAIYVLVGAVLWKIGALSVRTDLEFLAWPFFVGAHENPPQRKSGDAVSRVQQRLTSTAIRTGIDRELLDAIAERKRIRELRLEKAEATLRQDDWLPTEMDGAQESMLLRSRVGLEAATSRRNAALRLRAIRERDAHALRDLEELMSALEAQLVLLEFQEAPDLAAVQTLWRRVSELTADWGHDSPMVEPPAP